MEIQFFGANCLRLNYKNSRVVIDDNLAELGLKSITKAGDIVLNTNTLNINVQDVKLVIDLPGEYEVAGLSIQGVAARAHIDETGQFNATIFKIIADDLKIAICGHIFPQLSDDQLEELGTVDVLVVPVGGHGYTLDAEGALSIIKKIEPKLVIPSHYNDNAVNYPVPQDDLENAIKVLALEVKDRVPKIKLKSTDFSESTQLLVLTRE